MKKVIMAGIIFVILVIVMAGIIMYVINGNNKYDDATVVLYDGTGVREGLYN